MGGEQATFRFVFKVFPLWLLERCHLALACESTLGMRGTRCTLAFIDHLLQPKLSKQTDDLQKNFYNR